MKPKHVMLRKQKEKARNQAAGQLLGMFQQAENEFWKSPSMADRTVMKVRKLAMKHKIRLPSKLQRMFCKHCKKFLMPSVNSRVRLREGKVIYYCLQCKKYTKLPYMREQKERRARKLAERAKAPQP